MRRPDQLWSIFDAEKLDSIGEPSEEDFKCIEAYYDIPDGSNRPLRKSIGALLDNWDTEIQRARVECLNEINTREFDLNDPSDFYFDPTTFIPPS